MKNFYLPSITLSMYSTEETARMLNCSTRTVWNMVHDGRIRSEKIQGRWMFTEDAIREYLEGQQKKRPKQNRSPRYGVDRNGDRYTPFENVETLF